MLIQIWQKGQNPLRIGKGLWRLGLAEEGKNILEANAYWDKIADYLFKKQFFH